jgi:hypothetical protein
VGFKKQNRKIRDVLARYFWILMDKWVIGDAWTVVDFSDLL